MPSSFELGMDKSRIKYRFCSSAFMYNTLQNYGDKSIVFDTRDPKFFEEMHINNAISLTSEKIQQGSQMQDSDVYKDLNVDVIQTFLTNDEKARFSKRRRCFCFIILHHEQLCSTLAQKIKEIAQYDEIFDDYFELDPESFLTHWNRLESGTSNNNLSCTIGLNLFQSLMEDKVRETYILFDGAVSFFTKYHFYKTLCLAYPLSKSLNI
mgnify:CR=1 FL=1